MCFYLLFISAMIANIIIPTVGLYDLGQGFLWSDLAYYILSVIIDF